MGALLDRLAADGGARRIAFGLLLAVYAAVVLAVQQPVIIGDEWRYLWYAENLLHGYYSPPDFVFLWNGPGYPLLLAPFVLFGAPLLAVKLGNVALMGVAVFFFFRFVKSFSGTRGAVIGVAGLVSYLPLAAFLPFVYTEVAAATLVVLFVHGLFRYVTGRGRGAAWQAGLSLGWLALTKIVFGPLLWLGLLVSVALAIARRRPLYRQLSRVFALAVLVTVPYLVYSYGLTGRPFYWGSGGGSTLYWMSNPHPGQLGDWFHQRDVRDNPALASEHWRFISRIGKLEGRALPNAGDKDATARYLADLSSVEADLAFRKRAWENIRQHPTAYLENWVCNVSRLILDVPYTVRPFTIQSFLLGLANLLGLLVAVAALRTLTRRRAAELGFAWVLGVLLFSYLGMLSLVSASGRFFVPVAPLAVALGALAFVPTVVRQEHGETR